MSNQLEKVKELIELRTQARLGGGEHVSVSLCCLMKEASKNLTCL